MANIVETVPPSTEIYTFLIDRLILNEKHKEELMTKRGFYEDTINANKFRSTWDPELEGLLRGKFQEKDLIESGLFLPGSKEIRVNPILLQDRIIIPYLDKNDMAYYLRFSLPIYRRAEKDQPKMLSFTGRGVEVYQEKNLKNTVDVVITEGEFKAVAGTQFGIPTLSIPGISSFADKNYSSLVSILKSGNVKKIFILFDNEVKDNPDFSNYKPEPQKRYDTQFYAYYMAQKLEASGFEVLIAWLPDQWRIDGKIDIDGALALGKTMMEMYTVLQAAVSREEFLKSLTGDAYKIVQRKISQKFHKSQIRREFNHYIATRQRGKSTIDEVISNFVINITATHDTIEGIRREIEFTNEAGRQSGSFTIDPKEMASAESFRQFCMGVGDYTFRGNIDDLLTIWESEFLMQDEGRLIYESDHVGFVEKEKAWVFQNIAITEKGELHPDKNNIFWFDKKGIKPVPLNALEGRHASMEGVPSLYTSSLIDIMEVKKRFSETIGYNETAIMLGWVNSVVFMEEIFDLCNSFPFLFITGQFQSGKSTIAELVMNFFGIENAGKAISQTTPVAIQRYLSYYSCLPTYLDEYRNTKEIVWKNGFLRNAYNRQSSGKGTKASSHSVRDAKVRGTLVIAGEETPKDGAVWSRCITLYVIRKKRTGNHYKWFMGHKTKFSSHFLDLLRRKKELLPEFLRIFEEKKEEFIRQDIEDRLAFNYAGVMAGYQVVFGNDEIDFMSTLVQVTQDMQEEFKEERALSVFFDDLGAMKTRKQVSDDYWLVQDGQIFLYFHGLHTIWSQEYRKTRGEEAFKEASIRSYLKEEPGFIKANINKQIKGEVKRCVVFDFESAPESLQNLVSLPISPDVYSSFTGQSIPQDKGF